MPSEFAYPDVKAMPPLTAQGRCAFPPEVMAYVDNLNACGLMARDLAAYASALHSHCANPRNECNPPRACSVPADAFVRSACQSLFYQVREAVSDGWLGEQYSPRATAIFARDARGSWFAIDSHPSCESFGKWKEYASYQDHFIALALEIQAWRNWAVGLARRCADRAGTGRDDAAKGAAQQAKGKEKRKASKTPAPLRLIPSDAAPGCVTADCADGSEAKH